MLAELMLLAALYEKSYPHDYAARFDPRRDGAPGVYNYYDPEFHPYYKGSDLHTMQSVSKSVTSLLVGIPIGRGELPGVDAPVLDQLKAVYRPNGEPRQARMQIRHVLSMTSGIGWDEDSVPYTDAANSCARMEASQDWVQFVLDQPMAEEPGARFVYNSGATQQRLLVVPSLDLVAVFTGWNVWERPSLSAHFALARLRAAVSR